MAKFVGMQKKENFVNICKLMNCKKCERRKVVVTKLVIGSHHVTQGRPSRIELLIANLKIWNPFLQNQFRLWWFGWMLVFGSRRRLFILEEDVTLGLVVNQQTLPEYKRCHYTFAPSLKECQTSAENLLILMSLLLGIFLRIFSHSTLVTPITPECPRTSPNWPKTSKNHPRPFPECPK